MYFDFEDHRPDTPTSPGHCRLARGRAAVGHRRIWSLVILILVGPASAVHEGDARRGGSRHSKRQRQKELERQQRESRTFVFVQPRVDIRRRSRRRAPTSPTSIVGRARPSARPSRRIRCRSRAGNSPSGSRPSPPSRRSAPQPRRRQPQPAQPQPDRAARADAARGADRHADARADPPKQPQAQQPARGRDRRRDPQRPEVRAARSVPEPAGRRAAGIRAVDSVRHQGRRVRAVAAPLHRADPPQLVHPVRRDVDARPRRADVQRPQGRSHHRRAGPAAVADRRLQPLGAQRDPGLQPDVPLPPEYPDEKAFFTVTFYFNETPPADRSACTRAEPRSPVRLGLLIVLAVLVALAFVRALGAP